MEYYETNELYHHGIKGQKWGVRRYQNPDGTLTEAGKKRLSKDISKQKFSSLDEATGYVFKKINPNAIRNLKELKEAKRELDNASRNHSDFFKSKEVSSDNIESGFKKHYSKSKNREAFIREQAAIAKYHEECKKATESLVGAYSNLPISAVTKGPMKGNYYDTVGKLVTRSINEYSDLFK